MTVGRGPAAPTASDITGLVLAGGRGQRMGGVDKGLQPLRGRALVDHAIDRLAPQVGGVLISANRHLPDYARRDARVLVDDTPGFAGPLAGILAGLRAAPTPWLAVVPCDAPALPLDLVARLAQGLLGAPPACAGVLSDGVPPAWGVLQACAGTPAGAGLPALGAVVERGDERAARRIEPVCCLLSTALAPALAQALAAGQRRVGEWVEAHAVRVLFDRPSDAAAFANINTLDDLCA